MRDRLLVSDLRFRTPLSTRIFVPIFAAGWLFIPAFALVDTLAHLGVGDARSAVGAVLGSSVMIAAGGTFFYRSVRASVTISGEDAVVRNMWRTHRIRRTEVRAVGLGKPTMARGTTLTLETASRTIPLDVLAVRSARRLPRRQADYDAVRAWATREEQGRQEAAF